MDKDSQKDKNLQKTSFSQAKQIKTDLNKKGYNKKNASDTCSINTLKMYLSDKNKEKAMKHAQTCLDCMEKLVAIETWLATNRQEKAFFSAEINSDSMLECIDRYQEAVSMGRVESFYQSDKEFLKIRKDEKAFLAFQQLVQSLDITVPLRPTPEYLKVIVANKLAQEKEKTDSTSIVILMKNGVRLLTGALENVIMSDGSIPVATRSTLAPEKTDTGALEFMFGENEVGNVHYQVVQDGPETVMLTVRLENFPALPKFVNLKKFNRTLHSFSMKGNSAYFGQLYAGYYSIELKDYASRVIRRMDIQVVKPDA